MEVTSGNEDIEVIDFIGRHKKGIAIGLLLLVILGYVVTKELHRKVGHSHWIR